MQFWVRLCLFVICSLPNPTETGSSRLNTSRTLYKKGSTTSRKMSKAHKIGSVTSSVPAGVNQWLFTEQTCVFTTKGSLREMVSIIKEQLSYKSRENMTDSVKNLQVRMFSGSF